MIRNPKTRIVIRVTLQVHTLKILHHLKNRRSSGGASIGAHVLETNKQLSCPSRTVEKILEVHPMSDDDFLGGTNPGDVSIDTANSKEMMVGSHITEQNTHECE